MPPPRPDGAKAYGLSVSEPDGSLVLVPLRRLTGVYRKRVKVHSASVWGRWRIVGEAVLGWTNFLRRGGVHETFRC